jgi:hypothetical protein
VSHFTASGKTYDYRGRYLIHSDTGAQNQDGTLYFGDEFIDGSLRLVPDTSHSTEVEFQRKAEGVWNDTGIQIAASTIFLGRDLEVKGAGDWIHTTDVQDDHLALIPHIEYTDETGTFPYTHVPILSPLNENVPIQPIFDTEIVTDSYVASQINPAELLAKNVHYKTGSVAATEQVTIEFSRPPGTVFWMRNFPASKFAASSDITIELKGLLEGFPGELITTTITSDANFSLLGNSSEEIYTLLDFYLLSEESVVTFETGLDNVITSYVHGDVMVNSLGNLMNLGAINDVA